MVMGCQLQLRVEPDSLTRTELGIRSGIIYFETREGYFPSIGWNDLAPDFSFAWLNAIMRIITAKSKAESIFFMDGPYVIELSSKNPGFVDVLFVEDRPKGKIERGFIKSCSTRELLQNAMIVLEQLQHACQAKGWQVDPAAVSMKLKEASAVLHKTAE
jgi:hypothetical protein